MLFNSLPFLIFFSVVVLLFYFLPHNYRKYLLLCASYFFYMLWKPEYGLLILASTVLSYLTALVITRLPFDQRRKYVILCLFIGLGLLFFFKYFNFFNSNFRILFSYLDLHYPVPDLLTILFPVGISFYTFETISYVLDVYYDRRPAERNLSVYALYISFFPKLLAGPIERSTGLLVQLHNKIGFDYERITEGLRRMLWGFFKKIVIADRLALLIDPVYANPDQYSGLYVLMACYLFAFQIYCDFSGYTDIAIGASKVLGYDIVENFDRPYVSRNVGEFWRRWHISLSCWLKDYLFTPIVFRRKTWNNWALVYATFITFILCGLWHGPKWTFVIFGVLQGVVISYELVSKKWRKSLSQRLPAWVYDNMSWLLTFHFTVFSFIFFRADNVRNAFDILRRIGQTAVEKDVLTELSKFGMLSIAIVGIAILYMSVMEKKFQPSLAGMRDRTKLNYVYSIGTFTTLIILGYFTPQIFIYFNF